MDDYFKLLGIERHYGLDLNAIEKSYIDLQAQYHPDATLPDKKRHDNHLMSIKINAAYKTLKDPFERANHLLLLNNININASERRNNLPLEQLSAVWDMLEIVQNNRDKNQLTALYQKQLLAKQQLIEKLTNAFAKHDFESAVSLTMNLKYLQNLLETVKDKMSN